MYYWMCWLWWPTVASSWKKSQLPSSFYVVSSKPHDSPSWLVVWTPLKNISQLGWLFPIYRKIKNVPNHQPDKDSQSVIHSHFLQDLTCKIWGFCRDFTDNTWGLYHHILHEMVVGFSLGMVYVQVYCFFLEWWEWQDHNHQTIGFHWDTFESNSWPSGPVSGS